MEYNFNNDTPIYIQLVEKLRIEIVSGRLKQSERLPSVREFALDAKVNPNTMQKALAELEEEGLIYTERTNGKFVTNDTELIKKIRKEIAEEKTKKYIKDMEEMGISCKQYIEYLKELGGK